MVIVAWVFQIFYILILVRVVLSWIRIDPYNPLVQFVYQVTEPLLAPIRRFLPPTGGLDLSPLILILLLSFLQRILFSLV